MADFIVTDSGDFLVTDGGDFLVTSDFAQTVDAGAYQAWLEADNKRRCILIEIDYYSGGEQTLYISNIGFISHSSDTPASTPYDDVASAPNFTQSLDLPNPVRGEMRVRAQASYGQIAVRNSVGSTGAGEFDDWKDYAFTGREIRIYRGDPSWAKIDFRLVAKGRNGGARFSQGEIVFSLLGKDDVLNVPIQTDAFSAGPESGKLKPLAYGSLYNIEPVNTDTATQAYQFHDGSVSAVSEIRDNGVALPGANYTVTTGTGTFTIDVGQEIKLTMDVDGDNADSTYTDIAAEIVERIAVAASDWDSEDIGDTFSAHASAQTQEVGTYIRNGDNLSDVIDELLSSVGSYKYIDRDGKLQVKLFGTPAGSADVLITQDDMLRDSFRIFDEIEPVNGIELGYKRNWTPQDADAVAGSVSLQDRIDFSKEYRSVQAVDATVNTTYPLASKPPLIESLLQDSTEAATEANRLLTLWKALTRIYEFEATLTPGTVNIGDTVTVSHPRYGFSSGLNCVVVHMREALDTNRALIRVWR